MPEAAMTQPEAITFAYGDSRNVDMPDMGGSGGGQGDLIGAFLTGPQAEREPGNLMVDFDERHEEHQKYLKEFFQKEPCLYTHRIFKFSAQVFRAVKHQRMYAQNHKKGKKDAGLDFPSIDFNDSNEKRLTFGLVFSTLKCK